MSSVQLIIVVMTLGVGVVIASLSILYFRRGSAQAALWDSVGVNFRDETTGQIDVEKLKKYTGRAEAGRNTTVDLELKLFRAGYFTERDKHNFKRFRITSFVVATLAIPILFYWGTGNPMLALAGVLFGVFVGYAFPITRVEKAIERRIDDASRALPLVIEQIAIGVSSSLDVGPCLSHITKMATERNSHNPVTEMFMHVEKLVRSGLNLEDALMEVGEVNGIADIKHAFLFLAQCSKHGGEISRQLQELADAMSTQRQMAIEGKITALPVKATGPLVFVFSGFFMLLFAGIVVRLGNAFTQMNN